MNLVYKITLEKRKQENIMPYMYIGSKSNAIFENGMIFTKSGIPYYGSSSYENYLKILESDRTSVEILKEFDNYVDALNYKSYIQKELDVVADPRYFNLAIATINNFTNPDYATYKHISTGKTVRLERNHPMVLSGEYVGVSKDTYLTEEQRRSIGRSGSENPFFGKKHSNETKEIISKKNKGRKVSSERKEWFIENVAKKKKSIEHRNKIGRKNMIMLKNKETNETIRIHKSDENLYDKNIWKNPYTLSENKSTGSRWITNGIENKKIRKDETKPEGWEYGRTYNGWNKKKG